MLRSQVQPGFFLNFRSNDSVCYDGFFNSDHPVTLQTDLTVSLLTVSPVMLRYKVISNQTATGRIGALSFEEVNNTAVLRATWQFSVVFGGSQRIQSIDTSGKKVHPNFWFSVCWPKR